MADADTASAPAEADGWAPPESMYLADHFQQDITQLRCLRCGNEAAYDARSGRAAPGDARSPCQATLHPFCDAFHTWVRRRLDGSCSDALVTTPHAAAQLEAESDAETSEEVEVKLAALKALDYASDSGGSDSEEEDGGGVHGLGAAAAAAADGDADDGGDGDDGGGASAADDGESGGEDAAESGARGEGLSSEVADLLEAHVGEANVQRRAVAARLKQAGFDGARVAAATEDIIGWYHALSMLACAFPSAGNADDDDDEGEGGGGGGGMPRDQGEAMVTSAFPMPKQAGRWMMGLQALREAPNKGIKDSSVGFWRAWRKAHHAFLRKSNRKLVRAAQRHPTKLLHKWLAVNDYCDYVQQTFVAMFSDEVLKEWYAKQGSWCQGSANVVMALLVGVEAWNGVRDFMNARTRQFRHDPHAGALQTARSGGELLALLRQAHTAPFAVYVELDCWHRTPPPEEGSEASGSGGRRSGGGSPTAPTSPVAARSPDSREGPPTAADFEAAAVAAAAVKASKSAAEAVAAKVATAAEKAGVVGRQTNADVADAAAAGSGATPATRVAAARVLTEAAEAVAIFPRGPPPTPSGVACSSLGSLSEASSEAAVAETGEAEAAEAEETAPTEAEAAEAEARATAAEAAAVARLAALECGWRANGGHVFVVVVEPAAEGAATSYTVHSSWSGRYTLAEWQACRPEMYRMAPPMFDRWLSSLEDLLAMETWGADTEAHLAFMFGCTGEDGGADEATAPPAAAPAAEAAAAAAEAEAEEEGYQETVAALAAQLDAGHLLGAREIAKLRAARDPEPTGGAGEAPREAPPNFYGFEAAAAAAGSGAASSPPPPPQCPAGTWWVEEDEAIKWEFHFWGQRYDDALVADHADVMEHLQAR